MDMVHLHHTFQFKIQMHMDQFDGDCITTKSQIVSASQINLKINLHSLLHQNIIFFK